MANTERTQSQPQSQQGQPPEKQSQTQAGSDSANVQRADQGRAGLARLDPFSLLIERLFEGFGLGRHGFTPSRIRQQAQSPTDKPEVVDWIPNVEMSQQANELVVRADLPGMDRGDIDVEIADDMLVVRGERRQEQREQDENGWVRTEVSYGSFVRTIPLPDGTIADSAVASFKNGVLEVRLQTPPQEVSRGRKINIQ